MPRIISLVIRLIGGSVLGATGGLLFGIVNMMIFVPPDVPGDPLAHEWYMPGCLFLALVEGLGGAFLGSCIGALFRSPWRRWKAAFLALAGATVGTLLG